LRLLSFVESPLDLRSRSGILRSSASRSCRLKPSGFKNAGARKRPGKHPREDPKTTTSDSYRRYSNGLERRRRKTSAPNPAPINPRDAGSGATPGIAVEENVPSPEARNGPAAGCAWPAVIVPTENVGLREDRLNEAVSLVWPVKTI